MLNVTTQYSTNSSLTLRGSPKYAPHQPYVPMLMITCLHAAMMAMSCAGEWPSSDMSIPESNGCCWTHSRSSVVMTKRSESPSFVSVLLSIGMAFSKYSTGARNPYSGLRIWIAAWIPRSRTQRWPHSLSFRSKGSPASAK